MTVTVRLADCLVTVPLTRTDSEQVLPYARASVELIMRNWDCMASNGPGPGQGEFYIMIRPLAGGRMMLNLSPDSSDFKWRAG